MKFFINLYLKIINRFWKLVLLKVIKLIVSSTDYVTYAQLALNILSDINLINLNCLVTLVISSVTGYMFYKSYSKNCEKKLEIQEELLVIEEDLALVRANYGYITEATYENVHYAARKAIKAFHLCKGNIDADAGSLFLRYVLFCASLIGFSITYDTDKLVSAYNFTKH